MYIDTPVADPTAWHEEGTLSVATKLALLGLLEDFDRDGDGKWKRSDFNTCQMAAGEAADDLPASDEEFAALVGDLGAFDWGIGSVVLLPLCCLLST